MGTVVRAREGVDEGREKGADPLGPTAVGLDSSAEADVPRGLTAVIGGAERETYSESVVVWLLIHPNMEMPDTHKHTHTHMQERDGESEGKKFPFLCMHLLWRLNASLKINEILSYFSSPI